MDDKLLLIEQNFISNVEQVYELVEFDKIILDITIEALDDTVGKLKSLHNVSNPHLIPVGAINQLKQIRNNDSLEQKYNIIFNQCIVLLVSYFGSTINDIFKAAINLKATNSLGESLSKEEIKLSVLEILELEIGLWDIGELFTMKKEISFQDMQSISRAFKNYIDIDIEKNNDTNNIIVGQACRHVIVHSGNNADSRLLKQVANAVPREIKGVIREGEVIKFNPDEIRIVGNSMKAYVSELTKKIKLL